MKATATELNKHPGRYLDQAIKEPVVVERSGRPIAVLLSYERYIQLEENTQKQRIDQLNQSIELGLLQLRSGKKTSAEESYKRLSDKIKNEE